MDLNRFSVIIATYNRATLLRATLDSVLKQDFTDYEIIVVDDGSTDDTPAVLQSYGKRLLAVRQNNAGPGAARNRGIELAAGDYITFIDSDDLWLPWTLATFAKTIDQHNRPAFVASHTHSFTGDPTVHPGPMRTTLHGTYFDAWRDANWVPLCGVAVRSDVLRKTGGFSGKRMNYEESELWLKLGIAPGFVRIESPICSARREHEGNVTHDHTRSVAGVMHLIEQERQGAYPGGSGRRRQRLELITRHVRPLSLNCPRKDAWALYRATFAWHLRLARFRYLLGFPLRRLAS